MADRPAAGPRFAEVDRLRSAPGTRDQGHTERFTNEEFAYLRQVRFGQLPDPIPPSEWTEAMDTDLPYEPPEPRLGAPYIG